MFIKGTFKINKWINFQVKVKNKFIFKETKIFVSK